MATITSITGKDHYRTEVRTSAHQLVVDEPLGYGGKALGPAPDELLASALGSCTSITLRMYADRKGWPLESVQTTVTLSRESGRTEMTMDIVLDGPLDQEQRERLLDIAHKCPVHVTLNQAVTIHTVLK
ncbi:OsmC family protein [Taibaiella koreensis]|uniref:OsmC family protein n=1 Tax=Taibaiella koreensis TaxID=1268548 RepID=UPI000E59D7C0|nr:OsmC family protein [Taibaiella koreensis]